MDDLDFDGWIALLAPPAEWEPNLNVARARFEARLHRRSRVKRYWLAVSTAVIACVVLVTIIPSTRAFAHQIGGDSWFRVERVWNWITFVRPGPVLLVSLSKHVESLHAQPVTEPGPAHVVADATEAARLAGFTPRLPQSSMLKSPRLSVQDPMSYRTVVRTAELEVALQQADVSDVDIPKSWDGSQITLQIGTTITAEWTDIPDELSGEVEWSQLTLAQTAPPVVVTPPGFDLAAFTVANLRAAGMRNRNAALHLGGLNTTVPALLLANRTQHYVGVREVNLYSYSPVLTRPVTLIEEFEMPDAGSHSGWFDFTGPQVRRITLLWSAPRDASNRVYVLSGTRRVPSDMFSFDFAKALTEEMDLARAID